MAFDLSPKLALSALILAIACPIYSQVRPEARSRSVPLAVGVGVSSFDLDYGSENGAQRRMEGIAAWIDWPLPNMPQLLSGLSLEAEGRDINFGRPSALTRMRQDTAGGGPIYKWRHYRRFTPYAKFLMGIGSIDFPRYGFYSHDTRTVYTPGGGLEYRAFQHVWVRGDYEYQFWPQLFGNTYLNPNGLTIGVAYDFKSFNRR